MQLCNPLIWLCAVIGPYLAPLRGKAWLHTRDEKERQGVGGRKETAREIVAWRASPRQVQNRMSSHKHGKSLARENTIMVEELLAAGHSRPWRQADQWQVA